VSFDGIRPDLSGPAPKLNEHSPDIMLADAPAIT
jgi:hypothetical protein